MLLIKINFIVYFLLGENLVPKPPLQDQEKAAPDAGVQHAEPERETRRRQGPGQGRHAHFPPTENPHLPEERILLGTEQERLLRLRPNQQGASPEVPQDHPGVDVDSVSAVLEFYALVSLFQLLPSVADQQSGSAGRGC